MFKLANVRFAQNFRNHLSGDFSQQQNIHPYQQLGCSLQYTHSTNYKIYSYIYINIYLKNIYTHSFLVFFSSCCLTEMTENE